MWVVTCEAPILYVGPHLIFRVTYIFKLGPLHNDVGAPSFLCRVLYIISGVSHISMYVGSLVKKYIMHALPERPLCTHIKINSCLMENSGVICISQLGIVRCYIYLLHYKSPLVPAKPTTTNQRWPDWMGHNDLIHPPLVPHICVNESGQHWFQ